MNIQRVDSVTFLGYIAKYICKPEPNGFFKDTSELRERDDMPPAERFLNACVVAMPEAVHRTWGFNMRAGTGVTHLITQLPHLRMRAIRSEPHAASTDDEDEDETDGEDEGAANASTKLEYADGTLEQYQNRPTCEDGEAGDWGKMLYPDFHRKYACAQRLSPASPSQQAQWQP